MYALTSLGVEKAYEMFQEENDTDMRFYCVGHSVIHYYINRYPISNPEGHKAKILSAVQYPIQKPIAPNNSFLLSQIFLQFPINLSVCIRKGAAIINYCLAMAPKREFARTGRTRPGWENRQRENGGKDFRG